MKKKILSQLFIVSFAFAGLFLVGNNVKGVQNPPGNPGPGITCNQQVKVGALCWKCNDSPGPCYWTGYMTDTCCQWA